MLLLFAVCYLVGIIQNAGFLDWLLLLSDMHIRCLHVFLWVDSSLKKYLNNVLLSRCTAVYLFISLLKEILVELKFLAFMYKASI